MVIYEWITETRDEHGDITDTSSWNTKADAIAFAEDTANTVVALLRDTPDERLWAYIGLGAEPMPEVFSDAYNEPTGYRVPQRFRA